MPTPNALLIKSLNTLNTPAVRDLAWVLFSPNICDITPPRPAQLSSTNCLVRSVNSSLIQQLQKLQQLDQHPQLLTQWLEHHNTYRLGKYFELLVEFFLRYFAEVDDIKSAITVRESLPEQHQVRTVGEFDFLYRPINHSDYTHLEVTVKFFLCSNAPEKPAHWIGPNAKDNLYKKASRMSEHQLQLSRDECGKNFLKQQDIEVSNICSLFKGRLFHHWDNFHAQYFITPIIVNFDHLKGWWIYADDLPRKANATSYFSILPRLCWLAPLQVSDEQQLINRLGSAPLASLQIAKMVDNRPIMVAHLEKDDKGIYREVNRGFVVPRSWSDGSPQ